MKFLLEATGSDARITEFPMVQGDIDYKHTAATQLNPSLSILLALDQRQVISHDCGYCSNVFLLPCQGNFSHTITVGYLLATVNILCPWTAGVKWKPYGQKRESKFLACCNDCSSAWADREKPWSTQQWECQNELYCRLNLVIINITSSYGAGEGIKGNRTLAIWTAPFQQAVTEELTLVCF